MKRFADALALDINRPPFGGCEIAMVLSKRLRVAAVRDGLDLTLIKEDESPTRPRPSPLIWPE
jgi:hypothetical protein